jgi:hypothetical protein
MSESRSGVLAGLRGAAAIIVGIAVNISLAFATDELVYLMGLAPPVGQLMSSPMLAVAATYRTIYSVISSYIIAALAPRRPMLHAMIAGTLGFVLSIVGVVMTWSETAKFGPHWYPISLVVTALPSAWLGAKIWEIRARSKARAAA